MTRLRDRGRGRRRRGCGKISEERGICTRDVEIGVSGFRMAIEFYWEREGLEVGKYGVGGKDTEGDIELA